jgi:hypothetical protein
MASLEEIFLRNFIERTRQQRYLEGLMSEKESLLKKALNRFFHQVEFDLIRDSVRTVGRSGTRNCLDEFAPGWRGQLVYVRTNYEDYDKRYLPAGTVLDALVSAEYGGFLAFEKPERFFILITEEDGHLCRLSA